MKYYIEAFKSGSYPSVARDDVFLWVEAHPQKGNYSASKDGSGRADGRKWVRLMPRPTVLLRVLTSRHSLDSGSRLSVRSSERARERHSDMRAPVERYLGALWPVEAGTRAGRRGLLQG